MFLMIGSEAGARIHVISLVPSLYVMSSTCRPPSFLGIPGALLWEADATQALTICTWHMPSAV